MAIFGFVTKKDLQESQAAIIKYLNGEGSPVNAAEPAKLAKRPACMQFDSEEESDFGRQVANVISMDGKNLRVHFSLRFFTHPVLGSFEFDDNDQLQHFGNDDWMTAGQYAVPNHVRALTKGDQKLIVEALRHHLQTAVEIPQAAPPTAQTAGFASAISQLQAGVNKQRAQAVRGLLASTPVQRLTATEMQRQMEQLAQTIQKDYAKDHMADALTYGTSVLKVKPEKAPPKFDPSGFDIKE